MKMKKKKNYVDNKEFLKRILDYQSMMKDNPDLQVPNHIVNTLYKIVNGLANHYKFNQYTYKEDMIQVAILDCWRAVGKFDPNKLNKNNQKMDNPHAYFSMISERAMVRFIQKEKGQKEIKDEIVSRSSTLETHSKHPLDYNNYSFTDEIQSGIDHDQTTSSPTN